jgi:uncharacterized delta-60 repeat protein
MRFTALLLACAIASHAFAASGDLDPTLLGGRVQTDFDGWFDQAQAAVVLPDGKIVAAGLVRRKIGETTSGIPLFRAELGLVRYTATGVVDDTFGDEGVVRTDFGQDVDVRVLLRDPADGDLIAVGNTPSFPQQVVFARYATNGTPDASVGGGTGRAVTAVPGFAYAGYVRADGKIVVGGSGRNTSGFDAFLLARFLADGTPDPGFDGDGFLISNQGAAVRGMVEEPDGDIVAGGWGQSGSNNGFRNFVAARFTAAGVVDAGFGPDATGRVVIDFFNASGGDEGRALARRADGTLVIGGFAYEGAGFAAQRHFALARLDANGVLDGTFGGGTGKVATDVVGDGIVRNLLVQSSGAVVAVGETGAGLEVTAIASDKPELTLARYDAAGMLDATFGDDGTITHRLRATEAPRAAVLQPDDKPVVVGRVREDWHVLRLTATGQADSTFGSGGRVLVQGDEFLHASGGALQDDGKILVAGSGLCREDCAVFNYQSRMALTRHLPDGRLDESFGDLGLAMPAFTSTSSQVAVAAVVLPDDTILAGGTSRTAVFGEDDDFAVAHLGEDGTPDAAYGTDGLATADFAGGDDVAIAMTVQTDGKAIVVGEVPQGNGIVFGVARFTTGGQPDPSFGGDGTITTDLPGVIDRAQSVLVQPDGTIIVVGTSYDDASGVVALVRYTSTGTPDPGFGTNGVVLTPLTANFDGGADVIRRSDGRLVVSGWVDFGGDEDFVVLRYLASGTLDGTFGVGGVARTDPFGFHRDDEAITLTEAPDGKLVLVGDTVHATDDFVVARFSAGGLLDTAFGAGGHMLVDLFETADYDPRSALLQPDGRLVGIGTTDGMGFFRMEMAGGPQATFPPPPPSTTTSTTVPGGSTTTTTTTIPGGSTSTTTTVPGGTTTTTTLPGTAEICGNCADDDGDGDVDYDDAQCCAATGTLALRKAQLKPGAAGTKLKLTAQLGDAAFSTVDPTAADLYVRLAGGNGSTILCTRIPATSVKRKKKGFQFADKGGSVASGISSVKGKLLKTQALQLVIQGKRARTGTPEAGFIALTLAYDAGGGDSGQCAGAVQRFRTIGKNKGVRYP